MKRFIKNNLKVFVSIIISGIVFTGIGVYAASTYLAHDISYTPSNDNFEVNNVEDALNELYSNKTILDLLWINENIENAFSEKTLNIDLSNYSYVIIDCIFDLSNIGTLDKVIVKKGTSNTVFSDLGGDTITRRDITVNEDGIVFSIGKWYDKNGSHTGESQCIPYHIYGISNFALY